MKPGPNTTIAYQTQCVLDHLRSHRSITPREALDKYGVFRLGARIYDLRQMGHNIITNMVENEFGNAFAEYVLLQQAKPSEEAA